MENEKMIDPYHTRPSTIDGIPRPAGPRNIRPMPKLPLFDPEMARAIANWMREHPEYFPEESNNI